MPIAAIQHGILEARNYFASPTFLPTNINGLQMWLKADAGTLTDGASHFTAASSQYYTRASDSGLQIGAGDYTVCTWVYLDSLGITANIVAKRYGTTPNSNYEYALVINSSNNPQVAVRDVSGNTFIIPVSATTLTTGTWYFLCFQWTASTFTAAISVNNGAFTTASGTSGPPSSAQPLAIGCDYNNGTPVQFFDGRQDSIGIWQRKLSAAEITSVYNSGAGVRFADLTAGLKTSLSAWYDFQSSTTLTTDASGNTRTLTAVNAPTFISGVVISSAVNNDPVTTWQDQTANGNNVTQSTATKRPLYKTSLQNTLPGIQFDGVDDFLSNTFTTVNQPTTIFYVFKHVVIANNFLMDGSDVTNRETLKANAGNFDANAGSDTNLGADDTNAHILLVTYNGASSSFQLDGGSASAISSGTNAIAGVHVGSAYDGTTPSNVNFYEVGIYNSALAASDLASLKSYLNTKWSVF